MKKKLFIIGCTGVPARYGGFETFAENIAYRLSKNFEVYIICSTTCYTPDERTSPWNTITRIFLTHNPHGIKSLLYDWSGLQIARQKSDCILLLGSGAGFLLPFIRFKKSQRLLIHIDGLEWQRPKWNPLVRILLKISHFICLQYAEKIILDSPELNNHIPGRFRKKILNIGYGGDHLPLLVEKSSPVDFPYALTIARAEPENNLHKIIRVFLNKQHLRLVIISNWQASRYGRKIYNSNSKVSGIHLIDAIYDDKIKLQQYRMNCSVYIHGHTVGGTNPSLVEAMYTGIPVIAWDNKFNRLTTNNHALYFSSEQNLASLIQTLNSQKLQEKTEQLQKFAMHNYSWKTVCEQLFRALHNLTPQMS